MENSIERIATKVEEFVNKQITEFEKNPLSSSIRILLIYLLVRFAWRKIK